MRTVYCFKVVINLNKCELSYENDAKYIQNKLVLN